MHKVRELTEKIEAKRAAMGEIFRAYPDLDMPDEKAEEARKLNLELQDLGKSLDRFRELSGMAAESTKGVEMTGFRFDGESAESKAAPQAEVKDLGKAFADAAKKIDAYDRQKMSFTMPGVNLKTVMTLAAGFTPANNRTNIVVPSAQPRPVVADLIPQTDTDLQSIRYMEETTFTNSAAGVLEGAVKPESALAYTERSRPVEVIAHFLPVTMQQLEDVPGIASMINDRMILMLQLVEEDQLLNGTGTSPALLGFLNASGIGTQALGVDARPDAIYKAITQVRWTGFADPSGVIMNPTDYQNIRLLRTADGVYIWGAPTDVGVERVWGLPVVPTPKIAAGTALVGDFRMYSQIYRRMGLRIDVSNSHSDFFIRNQLAIRVEERLALIVYRGAAFCKVTGL